MIIQLFQILKLLYIKYCKLIHKYQYTKITRHVTNINNNDINVRPDASVMLLTISDVS